MSPQHFSYARGGAAAVVALLVMLSPVLVVPGCSDKPTPAEPKGRYKIHQYIGEHTNEYHANVATVTPMGLVSFVDATTGKAITLGGNFAILDRGAEVKP